MLDCGTLSEMRHAEHQRFTYLMWARLEAGQRHSSQVGQGPARLRAQAQGRRRVQHRRLQQPRASHKAPLHDIARDAALGALKNMLQL